VSHAAWVERPWYLNIKLKSWRGYVGLNDAYDAALNVAFANDAIYDGQIQALVINNRWACTCVIEYVFWWCLRYIKIIQ
jgi:hypothetical protein